MRQRAREIITTTQHYWRQGTDLRSHWFWEGRLNNTTLRSPSQPRPPFTGEGSCSAVPQRQLLR